MKYIALHLPAALLGVMLALLSLMLLGQTHIFSYIVGSAWVADAADIAFFVLALLCSLLIWRLGQRFPSPIFSLWLWIMVILLSLLLF